MHQLQHRRTRAGEADVVPQAQAEGRSTGQAVLMPRIVTCHLCKIITKFPDVPQGTPMVPARMIFKDGSDFTYKDDDGLPVMVPQFDPMLEDFVERTNTAWKTPRTSRQRRHRGDGGRAEDLGDDGRGEDGPGPAAQADQPVVRGP